MLPPSGPGGPGGAGGNGRGGAVCNLSNLAIGGSTFFSNSVTGGLGGPGGFGGSTRAPSGALFGDEGGAGGQGGSGEGGALFIGGEASVVNSTFAWNTGGGQAGGQGGQGGYGYSLGGGESVVTAHPEPAAMAVVPSGELLIRMVLYA